MSKRKKKPIASPRKRAAKKNTVSAPPISTFQIDGYLENTEDIYGGRFEFKTEEDGRVLYPFMKLRSGGNDSYPQYCYILNDLAKNPKVL